MHVAVQQLLVPHSAWRQLGFKQTESRETFAQRLLAFRDGVIVEPQVRRDVEKWRAQPSTCVAGRLHHVGNLAGGRDVFFFGSWCGRYARLQRQHAVRPPSVSAPSSAPAHTHVVSYISSMVVHPSQRGKRLGESYVVRLIAQVGLPLAAADAVVVLASANALAAPANAFSLNPSSAYCSCCR